MALSTYLRNYVSLLIAQYSEGENKVMESDIFPNVTPTPVTPVIPTTPDDHGDAPSNATIIQPNSTTNGIINSDTDVDYFKFTTTESGRIRVSYSGTTTSINLKLYDASLNLLASSSGNVLSETVYKTAGDYYISVSGVAGTAVDATYSVVAAFTPMTSLTTTINYNNSQISGTKASSTEDVWFIITTPMGGVLNPIASIQADMTLRVYDNNLNLLTARASDEDYDISSTTTYFRLSGGTGTYNVGTEYYNTTLSPIRTNLVMEYNPSNYDSVTKDTYNKVSNIKNTAEWDTNGVYDLGQTTDSAKPIFGTVTGIGNRYLLFSGAQEIFNGRVYANDVTAGGTDYKGIVTDDKMTIFFVVELTEQKRQHYFAFDQGRTEFSDWYTLNSGYKHIVFHAPWTTSPTGTGSIAFEYGSRNTTQRITKSFTAAEAVDKKMLFRIEVNGTYKEMNIYGENDYTITTTSTNILGTDTSLWGRWTIGDVWNENLNLKGMVYDLIVYNNIMTDADSTTVTNHLKTKHGIS